MGVAFIAHRSASATMAVAAAGDETVVMEGYLTKSPPLKVSEKERERGRGRGRVADTESAQYQSLSPFSLSLSLCDYLSL